MLIFTDHLVILCSLFLLHDESTRGGLSSGLWAGLSPVWLDIRDTQSTLTGSLGTYKNHLCGPCSLECVGFTGESELFSL